MQNRRLVCACGQEEVPAYVHMCIQSPDVLGSENCEDDVLKTLKEYKDHTSMGPGKHKLTPCSTRGNGI